MIRVAVRVRPKGCLENPTCARSGLHGLKRELLEKSSDHSAGTRTYATESQSQEAADSTAGEFWLRVEPGALAKLL